jgi:hypothetical protein
MGHSDARCVGEVAVVSAAGAVIGGLAAIHFGITAPIGVIIAIVVGGLAGYFLYQPREVVIGARQAYAATKTQVADLTWVKAWVKFKPVMGVCLTILAVLAPVASWCFLTVWLNDLAATPKNRQGDFVLAGLVFWVVALSIAAIMGEDKQAERWFRRASWRYLNPIAAAVWIMYGCFLALRGIYRWLYRAKIWAPRLWLALRVFAITFFRKIHSHWRGVCAFSCAVGAIVGFATHNVVPGAIVAAILGTCVLLVSIAAMRIQLPKLSTGNGS